MKRSTDLSAYNNDWFKETIGASRIRQAIWYIVNILFFMNPLNPVSSIKCTLLRWFGARVGKGVVLKPGINIKYPWKLSIGNHSWIGEKVWIDNLGDVTIGKNVCISQGAMLLTGNHNFTKSNFDLMVAGIILEEGVWIGAQALVCPGVNCATHAVLTAKSVATNNLEAYTIYKGNPAVAVKERVISE